MEIATNIHIRLVAVYGNVALYIDIVRKRIRVNGFLKKEGILNNVSRPEGNRTVIVYAQ